MSDDTVPTGWIWLAKMSVPHYIGEDEHGSHEKPTCEEIWRLIAARRAAESGATP